MRNPPPPPALDISIRPLGRSDAPALYAMVLAQGRDLDAFAWRERIGSEQDELAFIEWAAAAEARGEALSRAILADGELCGCASLYRPHPGTFEGPELPTLQAGYWVDRGARGHGASWRAMRMLMDEARAIMPEGSTVGIRARSRNGASLACAAKLGLLPAPGSPPSMFDPDDTDVVLVGPIARAEPPAEPAARRPSLKA